MTKQDAWFWFKIIPGFFLSWFLSEIYSNLNIYHFSWIFRSRDWGYWYPPAEASPFQSELTLKINLWIFILLSSYNPLLFIYSVIKSYKLQMNAANWHFICAKRLSKYSVTEFMLPQKHHHVLVEDRVVVINLVSITLDRIC